MKSITKKTTDDCKAFTIEEYNRNGLAPELYFQILMECAAEYLVEHNDEAECLKTLCMIPVESFESTLQTLIEKHSFFGSLMIEFVHHLERRGITWEGDVRITQQGLGEA